MKKLLATVLASALIVGTMAGCGFSGGDSGDGTPVTNPPAGETGTPSTQPPTTTGKDTLNYYDNAEVRTLVQWDASDTQSFTILNNVFEGLYRMDAEDQPQPALASGCTVSEDKLTYTFTLRDGLQWSNGTPLTASDFVFAWLKQMGPDATNNYGFIMSDYIVNGYEYFDGKVTADEVGVKALDDKTLEVKLTIPTPYFLRLTTLSMYGPLNEEFVTAQGDNYGVKAENMIYCGPYVITSYDPAVGSTLKKNETYWDAANVQIPNVNVRIIKEQSSALNAYKAGELDKVNLTSADVAAFKDDPEFHTKSEFRTTYLQFSLSDETMNNVNIRKALGYAIDRSILADVILSDGSAGAEGMVSFGVAGDGTKTFRELNGNLSPFDPAKAQEYWDKGVAELGSEPKITLLIADDSLTKDVATFVQSQFKENLGIDVTIDSKTTKARNELMDNDNFQFAITAWGGDYDDGMTFLDLYTNHTPYRGNYNSAEYDGLIASAKSETDDAARLQNMLDAEKLLVDTDAIISPLYYRGFAYLQKSDVKDLITHPFGSPVEFKYAYFG